MSDAKISNGNDLFELTLRHQANLDVKKKFVAALAAKDWDEAAKYVHPDFELREPAALPYGGVYKGMSGFRECLEKIPKISHRTERIEILRTYFTQDPDHLFSELDFAGVRVDTGERISSGVVEKFEFRDGKISAIVLYWFDIPDFKK